MTVRVIRWLGCDFPGCNAQFAPESYRAAVARNDQRTPSMRTAARRDGWDTTVEGDDLCPHHAALHQARPAQPALFLVEGGYSQE